jgi:hypothetical protein
LAAKIVKQRRINATLLTSPSLLDKVHLEVDRSFDRNEEDIRKLLRCVPFCLPSCHPDRLRVIALPVEAPPTDPIAVVEPFRNVYAKLASSESITCAARGIVFEPVAPPTAAIIDASHSFFRRDLC